jgi:hypothetical protein|tara:strand:- start:332 stop:643 length:312 start_codon:yes stop_codon:yes gene_type:complete
VHSQQYALDGLALPEYTGIKDPAPVSELYRPRGQFLQPRSPVAEEIPGTMEYSPMAHAEQLADEVKAVAVTHLLQEGHSESDVQTKVWISSAPTLVRQAPRLG